MARRTAARSSAAGRGVNEQPSSRTSPPVPRASTSERRLILLLASVQFVNVLDFMMVMPIGPDLAGELDIELSHLGWLSGAYTASASVAGVVGAAVLDRFDRRAALAVSMVCLAVGTALGGLSTSLQFLLATRVLAGAFGGPATSLCYAIIADRVPPERRGAALGAVMGAFSVAAVLGVPAGLEVARLSGWRTMFLGVGALCVLITVLAYALLPPLRGHLDARASDAPPRPIGEFLRDRAVLAASLTTWVAVAAGFAIIPNISAYFQHNLGYPRDRLWLLYMVGGAVAFAAMRVGGRLVDRRGAPTVAVVSTTLMAGILLGGFVMSPPPLPPLAIFVGFMLANSLRAIAASSLSTRVPVAAERARFMSTQAAVQHAASATGAIVSSLLLTELPSGALDGMHRVGLLSLALALTIPLLVTRLARDVRAREAERAPWVPSGPA